MPRPSRTLLSRDAFAALTTTLAARSAPMPPSTRRVLAGREAVRDGVVVPLGEGPAQPALDDTTGAAPHVPQPYRLTTWTESDAGWTAVNHRFEVDVHGATSMTHIDALDHFSWSGAVGRSAAGTLADLTGGLVSRGVLVDVSGVLDEPVPGGHVITLDDVRRTLDATRVDLRPGDALYVRLGRAGERRSDIPLGSEPMAGLSIECAEWLAEAGPSVVVSDFGLDPSPSEVEGVPVPWHILLLTVLGIPLVDIAMLAQLSETCARLGRWEFQSVLAPLPIPASSGSPVNPLAVF